MRKCKYCGKPEIVGVGKDNIPVCEKHYNDYLKKQFKPLSNLLKSVAKVTFRLFKLEAGE